MSVFNLFFQRRGVLGFWGFGVSAGVSAGGFCGTFFEAVPSDWTFLFLRGFCGVSAGPLLELRPISSILTFQILTNKK